MLGDVLCRGCYGNKWCCECCRSCTTHSPGAGPLEAGGDGVSSTAPQLHTDLQPRPLHLLPARPLPVQARATRAGRVPASSGACTRSATSRRTVHTSSWGRLPMSAARTGRRLARCPAPRCCAARWPGSLRVPAACARRLQTRRHGAMATRTGRASGAAPARLARGSRRSTCRPRRRRVPPSNLANPSNLDRIVGRRQARTSRQGAPQKPWHVAKPLHVLRAHPGRMRTLLS